VDRPSCIRFRIAQEEFRLVRALAEPEQADPAG
jgi:hypothetical protein